MDEVQVSLNLMRMQQSRSDGVDLLTSALVASTDKGMLSIMAKANAATLAPAALTDEDKLGLRATLAQMDAMGAHIRHLLGEDAKNAVPSDPVPQAEDDLPLPPVVKEAPAAPVTEPTPPSTVDHEGYMELD